MTTVAPPNQLSASVTRILSLSNFPPELKTRDLIAAFGEWEGEKGGFKIKWIDDQNALVVFADAGIAKKAYLQTLLRPHLSLTSSAIIRPYDGPDAQAIIANVNARTHGHNARNQSISGSNTFVPPNPNNNGPLLHHSSSSSSSVGHPAFSSGDNRSFSIPPPPGAMGMGGGGAHGHHRSSSQSASHHTRMGSFGTGSWGRAGGETTLANAASSSSTITTTNPATSFGHPRRESSAGMGGNRRDSAGGADAALGEIRRALQATGGGVGRGDSATMMGSFSRKTGAVAMAGEAATAAAPANAASAA